MVLRPLPGRRGYTAAMVAAQMLAQIGGFALPALLPTYMTRWLLSATEAGWLVGAFFAAYVVMVPILLALTDRYPARYVYLFGTGLTALSHLGFALMAGGFWSALIFRILAGAGWAATYMPGLKILADPLDGDAQSRVVSWHALGVGISNAASFAIAGWIAALAGPEAAFLVGAAAAAGAFLIAAVLVRGAPRKPATAPLRALLDYRPVLRNRPAMAWIAGYTVHTWEMAVLRAWGVTFFATAIAWHGAPDWLPKPTTLFTAAGLVGVLVSITGNETAQRFGRLRVVVLAMSAAAVLSVLAGWSAAASSTLAVVVVIVWNAAIYLDSAALTAGTVAAADKDRGGATMGLHSMCGYAGGFVGPPLAGFVLDLAGRDRLLGWGLAFGHLAVITLLGLAVLLWFARPRRAPAPVPA
ncbi:MAG: MFS transporter [Hyphomicrobiales bacterium]|nr:MFS transporter [Hyphomicrobiales bacterium]MBV8826413.1 MFS transporter [Hyphomicrobiales bacterium]MBV9430033.1 MFS transporter [Bradyrhizobiaceae bacterium]